MAWHLKFPDKPSSPQYLHKEKISTIAISVPGIWIFEWEKYSFSLKAVFAIKWKCPEVAGEEVYPANSSAFLMV